MYLDAVFIIPDAVGCHRWVVALQDISSKVSKSCQVFVYLTCSETNCVVPASSSHFPKNSSPKKGFSGFFSDPYLSLLLLYDDFNEVRNHFSTNSARLAGSGSEAGATKTDGCSVQYAENSVREVVPRMKGGAVMEERSPLKDAIDYTLSSDLYCNCTVLGLSHLKKRRPRAFILGRNAASLVLGGARHGGQCLYW